MSRKTIVRRKNNENNNQTTSSWRVCRGVRLVTAIVVVLVTAAAYLQWRSWHFQLEWNTTSDNNSNNSTTTTATTTKSIKTTAADWEREALAKQAAFCQSLQQQQQRQQQEQPAPASPAAAGDSPPREPSATGRRGLSLTNNNNIRTVKDTFNTSVPYGGRAFSMVLYATSDIVSRSMRRHRGYDIAKTRAMLEQILEYTKKRNLALRQLRFLDIGANVGWFTMLMASMGMQVIAVEPMEDNQQLLRRSLCLPENADLARNVILHGVGVSSVTRRCLVYSDNRNVGDGIMHCSSSSGGDDEKDDDEDFMPPPHYQVRGHSDVVRLDDLVGGSSTGSGDDEQQQQQQQRRPPIVAIKMDTEGHEGLVLQGGRRVLLQSHVPIIYSEFNAAWMAERCGGAQVPLDFMRDFMDAGYTVRREQGPVLDRSYVLDMQNWRSVNEVVLEYSSS